MRNHMEEGQRFIVAEYLAYSDRYKDLLDIQAGKDFYIPNDLSHIKYFSEYIFVKNSVKCFAKIKALR